MNPEDRSKIDELKKSLYSRTAPEIRTKRRLRFNDQQQNEVPTDWEHPPEDRPEPELTDEHIEKSHMAFTTKLFIGSFIFFILAVGIGAFLILNGENVISADNITISINGPATVSGGDPITFDVQVTNKNNVTLQGVDLESDFPDGTVDTTDRSKELKMTRETMDDIKPGGSDQKRLTAVLYGEENSRRQITLNVTYRVAGSNAVFKKTQTYDVLISSSPLSLAVDGYKEVTSGQEFQLSMTLTSNSTDVIKNLLLRAEYPFGFTLTSTDVKAEGNQTIWKIGDIPPHGKKTITFKGTLEGQDGEARNFRFTVGAASVSNPSAIATEYIAATKEVSIQKPFISTSIDFENQGDNGDYSGAFNAPVHTTISWFNNLSTAVTDGEIHLKLSGNAFDKNSVTPNTGYYQSGQNEIDWTKLTTESLASIGPGDSNSINFTFTPRDFSTPSHPVINPVINLDVTVTGKRLSESNVPETVNSSARRTIKISSNLTLGTSLSRVAGPFENTGPIPPKAEQQTTYTVTWTVDNTVNTVSGAQVTATLPIYVKWLGKTSPSTEDIAFNSNTNQISWNVGNVNTFTQNAGRTRTVSFQIAFTPSVAQVNQTPPLVNEADLTGVDDFTNATLTSSSGSMTTRFTDPSFQIGNDIVSK